MNATDKERARQWCDMYEPGCACRLMRALETEQDPRCKLYRDEPQECRYLKHVILGGGRKR